MTNEQEAQKGLRDSGSGTANAHTAVPSSPRVGRGIEGRERAAPQGSPSSPPSPMHTLMPAGTFVANIKDERSIEKWILHLPQ